MIIQLCGGRCCNDTDLLTMDDPEDVPDDSLVMLFRIGQMFKC